MGSGGRDGLGSRGRRWWRFGCSSVFGSLFKEDEKEKGRVESATKTRQVEEKKANEDVRCC